VTKDRISIPSDLAAEAMFASAQTCCVCTEPGKPVQIHHIDDDPSNNDPDNLAVMCLHCHDQTQVSGGFGRKLRAPLVRKHRTEWLARVAQRRAAADAAAIERMTGPIAPMPSPPVQPTGAQKQAYSDAQQNFVLAYAESLLRVRNDLKQTLTDNMGTTTASMRQATHDYIEGLQRLLVELAVFYPPGTFGEDPRKFFSEMTAARFLWHRAHLEPRGPGTGGTIVNVISGGSVADDLEDMLEDMVRSLLGDDDRFDPHSWFVDKGRTIKWTRPVVSKTETDHLHTVATASIPKFPLEVVEAVERLLPGYRLPQLKDIDGDWAEYRNPQTLFPFFGEGNFTGSLHGREYALFVMAATRGYMAIALTRDASGELSIHNLVHGQDAPQRYFMRTVPPGYYKRGESVTQYGGPSVVRLKATGINFGMFESADSLFYWNKETKLFERVSMSD
jgi:hypothetical protein